MTLTTKVRWARGIRPTAAVATMVFALALAFAPAAVALPGARPARPGAVPDGVIGYLSGVSAVNPSDVWAVGVDNSKFQERQRVVTEHWDGQTWSRVPARNPGKLESVLNDVTAVAADDVWAVGEQSDPGGDPTGIKTLIEHWNGSSWSVVKNPNPAGSYRALTAVTAVSADDVWAVGYFSPPGLPRHTLTVHWNGEVWSRVKSPDPSIDAGLRGVAAITTDDVWAVGYFHNYTTGDDSPMALHWDGSSWARVKVAPPGTKKSIGFDTVSGASTSDVWATGTRPRGQGFAEHWNGSAWSYVEEDGDPVLPGLAARTSNDVWGVGYDAAAGSVAVEHWDGSSWARDGSVHPTAAWLYDADSIAAGDVWAVGYFIADDMQEHLLVEHYDGRGWHQVLDPA